MATGPREGQSMEEYVEEVKGQLRRGKTPDIEGQVEGYAAATIERDGVYSAGLVKEENTALNKQKRYQVNYQDDLPDIVRRTEAQRAESMAARLWEAVEQRRPGEMAAILKMIQGDAWQKGKPVSYDEVKAVAIEQLKIAAAKAKEAQARKF